MNDNIAVSVKNVSKKFILPHEKKNSVKSIFTGLFRGKRTYSNQLALKDISFEIKKGEFFGIVGRNGSGKSTLLKIIAGIYQPTKGRVVTNGKLVPFIELGVGFNPELTGRENVFLNGALLGFTRNQIKENYNKIVSFAELEEHMDVKLKNYSSGMQVRLAFACATMAKADILVIDEVLAVGDSDFQRKCFTYFKSLKKDHRTVIFVSHDMSAVREYCDRAVLIEDSQLIEKGDVNTIASQYEKLFIHNEVAQSQLIDTNSKRWGIGTFNISNVSTKIDNEFITISQSIKSKNEYENPIVGFRIRNYADKNVMGTNTKIEKIKLGNFHKNQKKTIVWTIPNILADGMYYVDSAIMLGDDKTVVDWWDESSIISINKSRHLPYDIDTQIKIMVV